MKNIIISNEIGTDIRTRSFFRRDIERIIKRCNDNIVLDFINVNFISRAVADEICNLIDDYPFLSVTGMIGEVEKIYEIVLHGRNKPRTYSEINPEVYHLKDMNELAKFFDNL